MDNSNRKLIEELLHRLKCAAIKPENKKNPKISDETQMKLLATRKVCFLNYKVNPSKTRELSQLLEQTVTASSNFSRGEDQSSRRRRKYSTPSSNSGLYSEGSSGQIQNPHSSLTLSKFVDNALERSSPSDKEVVQLLDSDGPVVGDSNLSNPAKSFIQTPQKRPIKLLKSGNNDPRKQVRISPQKGVPPSFEHVNATNSSGFKKARKYGTLEKSSHVNAANSSGSKKAKKYTTLKKSWKSPEFFGDDFPRFPIPVGPCFQANIPERSCKPNCSADGDSNIDNTDKWLDKNAETSKEFIGKGRPSSCSCNSPGSTQCIKLHIDQSRLQLQHDLGSAFFDWKFDEMGEEVVKLWTPSKQKSFDRLVKKNPKSKTKSFWKPALKLFSSKSTRSIVSYYFNVFVLRRMSRQTRLACKIADTDDEGVGDTKPQYLTGIR
ncbi:hypothetical protein AQUCO_00900745v1 [Aquilegia coerulea]|uniref:ELM2 domain-containing protein n=1 Tax=Aquilegia coerulea TaxID=218851 RepID=A0A2G5EF84_AQUCA|nr:hypothetical protein AQUCO_00900745v1 [Aquilegia coerulea]